MFGFVAACVIAAVESLIPAMRRGERPRYDRALHRPQLPIGLSRYRLPVYVDPWALAVFFIALVLVAIGFIASSVAVCRGVLTERRRPKDG